MAQKNPEALGSPGFSVEGMRVSVSGGGGGRGSWGQRSLGSCEHGSCVPSGLENGERAGCAEWKKRKWKRAVVTIMAQKAVCCNTLR